MKELKEYLVDHLDIGQQVWIMDNNRPQKDTIMHIRITLERKGKLDDMRGTEVVEEKYKPAPVVEYLLRDHTERAYSSYEVHLSRAALVQSL